MTSALVSQRIALLQVKISLMELMLGSACGREGRRSMEGQLVFARRTLGTYQDLPGDDRVNRARKAR